jgi:NarL family two-component system response regulator LiaR
MPAGQQRLAERFEIGPLIGSGMTGNVYRGLDRQTGEPVAIKELRSEILAAEPELLERFLREGEALRRLNHPNIVKVLLAAEQNDQHYLVMEFIGGGSLADLLRRDVKLPIARVLSIGLEVADALTRAHHLNILHRDIKPANILLTDDGSPRLSDFGLARFGGVSSLTQAGTLVGTPYYLSPEACYGQVVDERTDIWSFGVVLFEMLTGQRPFQGETPFEVIYAIKNQRLPDPTGFREDIPPALVQLLRGMLRKDAAARISSARQVGAEMETLQRSMRTSGHPAQTASPAPPEKIRVLIVDDHAVVRQGLHTFIDLQEDMGVVGEGSNGVEGVELAGRLLPDVVLLDLVMPLMDGVNATREILEVSPHSHILILTSFGEDDKVFPAIRSGAQGYLLKDIHPNDLVRAIRDVNQGKVQLHPDIAKKLMSAVSAAPREQPPPAGGPAHAGLAAQLTERELEVLRLIARGMNNREIAEKMVISEKTVKTHVSNILGKLDLEDRTQAAIWALKNGFDETA